MKVNIALLFRFFRNENSEAEAEALGAWLEEDPAHEAVLRKAFQAFQAEQILLESRERKAVRWWRWVGVAAAAAAIFSAGFLLNKKVATQPALERINALTSQVAVQETQPGDRVRITLPDGSLVHLNADSRLEYFTVYDGGDRRVKLCGEAMFEVKSAPEQPFTVETDYYNVTATGTRFNVSADPGRDVFSTTLMKGAVTIRDLSGGTLFRLDPGQEAVLEKGGLTVHPVEDAEASALWAKGIISVSGVPFDKLMKTFERCYGVKIVIDRPDIPTVHYGLAKVRISNGVEYALNVLQKRSDFRYRYDEGTQTYHIF